jgi:hypothetical protein
VLNQFRASTYTTLKGIPPPYMKHPQDIRTPFITQTYTSIRSPALTQTSFGENIPVEEYAITN